MSTESNHQSHGHHSTSAAAPATDIVDEHGHGHSVAAWAGVAVCLVGFLILSLAVVFPSLTWGIIGGVVILASLVVAGGWPRPATASRAGRQARRPGPPKR